MVRSTSVMLSPAQRWLVAGTLVVGAAAAAALATAPERSFATLSGPVQSLMSITVPLLGILLVRGLRRSPDPARPGSTVLVAVSVAVSVAVAVGAFGVAACAIALALAPPGTAQNPWRHAGVIAVGSVLVQILAQLVGTGMGLLLRSAPVAFAATFVPLAVWLALGAADVLRPARAWLTPYETGRHLLSGEMSGPGWLQWLVVALIWGAALNAAGAARLARPGEIR